jgi:hypothetical protein
MLGAMDDIVTTYLHIFKQGCATHALDLMLEDWAKIDQFKDLIQKAKRVCIYICNHHVTMDSISRTLTMEVFDSASGNTICLLIPHDKSNA